MFGKIIQSLRNQVSGQPSGSSRSLPPPPPRAKRREGRPLPPTPKPALKRLRLAKSPLPAPPKASSPLKSSSQEITYQLADALRKREPYYVLTQISKRTQLLLRCAGYTLLILGLIDALTIIYPPAFLQPVWEYDTIGSLVERFTVPLVGLVLIFYRQEGYLSRVEKRALQCLSWLCLVLGILFFLAIPLLVRNTWYLYEVGKSTAQNDLYKRQEEIRLVEEKIKSVQTPNELAAVIQQLSNQPPQTIPQISRQISGNVEGVRKDLLAQLIKAKQDLETQVAGGQSARRKGLIENALKWTLAALLNGTILVVMFGVTSWTRRIDKWALDTNKLRDDDDEPEMEPDLLPELPPTDTPNPEPEPFSQD